MISKPPRTIQAPQRVAKAIAAPAADVEPMRLNKRMAALGLCSRREADAWLERGQVLVNGKPAELGQKVWLKDRIEIKQSATQEQAQQVTILLHKPIGYVSTQAEDGYEDAIKLITSANRWAKDNTSRRYGREQLHGLATAGRLDIDSTGLLVLTQDGRIARQLIGENSLIEKEYLVRVRYDDVSQNIARVFPKELLEKLRHGLSLDGKVLKPAIVDWQNPEQLRFVLKEGKKRQIRRMCEQVGLTVVGLKRIRIGRVVLGNLPLGQWRYLASEEEF